MNGRQFIVRVRKWARRRNLEVRFVASEGAGSHGTLYAGDRKTTVKDRKKEIARSARRRTLPRAEGGGTETELWKWSPDSASESLEWK